jgi:hypothetical protein
MTNPTKTPLLFLAGLLLAAPAATLAQDDMSDKERRKAARAEQAETRAEQDVAADAEARKAEEEAEKLRLEELGAAGAELPEAQKGFFVGIDAFLAEPSGPERSVARVGDIVTSATTAEELDTDANGLPDAFSIQNERDVLLEYDRELTPSLEIGWRRGTGAAFSVRYWGYSSDASVSATATQSFADAGGATGLILGGIDNQGFENVPGAVDAEAFARPLGSPALPGGSGLHGADKVTATGTFDATRVDLLYTHVGLVRPRFELHYRIGLTLLSAEREESAIYTWRSFEQASALNDAMAVETVTTTSDTGAVGLLTGVAGRFGLTEDRKWSVRMGLELSGLANEADLSFRDSWVSSQDGIDPITTVAQNTSSSPSNSLLTTIDADVALEGRIGSQLRLGLGYRYSNWLESLTDQSYPNAANQAALLEETVGVDFSGPYLRLSWFF